MTSAKATKDEVCSEPLSPALLFFLPEPHIQELVCIVNSHDSMPEKLAKVMENKNEAMQSHQPPEGLQVVIDNALMCWSCVQFGPILGSHLTNVWSLISPAILQ